MKLVSMKIDPKKREKAYEPTVAGNEPIYPWGLSLTLENETLEKLDLETLPDADAVVEVYAKARVTSVGVNDSSSGKRASLSLQITDLCLETPKAKKTPDADVLFKRK